jgi:hypothetical protein
LARYGGEEFCVALQSATVDEGVQLAERIRCAIEECLREPYGVTASFGVSGNQLGGKSFQAQLQQADQGLYASKRSGRNTVRCWSESLAHQMRDVERRALDRMQQEVVEEHPISYHAMVALCSAVAHRHPGLAAHSQRVAEMAVALGRGSMDIEQLYVLEIAAMLHEVGCLAEPEALTDDPSQAVWSRIRLTQMRDRNRSGLELLRSCMHSDALLETIEFQWHRFAATEGQKRSFANLPLGARILAVANAYDEMTSTDFGRGWSHDDAVAHLRSMSGRELDPELVERFIDRMVGWRPSGPIAMASIDGQQAVMLGYQLERVLQGFQGRNATQLKSRLQSLDQIAQGLQFAPMLHLLERLSEEVERRSITDWSSLLPWIEDLLELGMMVQREFLRSEKVFSPRGLLASRV